jgi:acyl-coenzyme A thioesterase PaaI-like protein
MRVSTPPGTYKSEEYNAASERDAFILTQEDIGQRGVARQARLRIDRARSGRLGSVRVEARRTGDGWHRRFSVEHARQYPAGDLQVGRVQCRLGARRLHPHARLRIDRARSGRLGSVRVEARRTGDGWHRVHAGVLQRVSTYAPSVAPSTYYDGSVFEGAGPGRASSVGSTTRRGSAGQVANRSSSERAIGIGTC